MITDKIFKNALAASIVFHLILFYHWPSLRRFTALRPGKGIEVTYLSHKRAAAVSGLISEKRRKGGPSGAGPKKISRPPPRGESKKLTNASLKKIAIGVKKRIEKPLIRLPDIEKENPILAIPAKAEMLISSDEKDFTDKPAYLNYYNAIRSRIYKKANARKPYYFMEGQVRLVFKLASDGSLLEAHVLTENSTKNSILISHALNSIKRAAPFPAFLASMEEDELTLRLTISFER